jgi:chromosome segregation ATPase
LQGKSFSWYSEQLEKCEAEAERLREELSLMNQHMHEDEAENERLRKREAELTSEVKSVRFELAKKPWTWANDAEMEYKTLTEEVERLREENGRLEVAHDHNIRRISRLRKAVNWLRGALHDESPNHVWYKGKTGMERVSVDDCDIWECQRARALLDEEAE